MAKRNENLKKYETTIRNRVECEERAFHIVNNLIDGKVDGPYLIKCGQMISREHYTDVIEERAISYLCGYPLCDHALTNIPKKQYHISTSTNKVYDISERKNFCSNQCLKASKHFCNQIPETPLYTRSKEAPADIKLLQHTEIRGIIGNEVVGTLPQKLLEKEIKKLEELEIRSPSSKKATQPPEKHKSQTNTMNKTVRVIKQDEKIDESLEGIKNEQLVGGNSSNQSSDVNKNEKPKELETEASVNTHEIVSLNINVNKHGGVTLPGQKENLKAQQEESSVIYSNNVIVNVDCENVKKDSRYENSNEQTTKMDYLMKLLSKRKEVLSGMIDVMTVVSDGGSQPKEETLQLAENVDGVSSVQDTLLQTPSQHSPSENLLQASENLGNLNQNISQSSASKVSRKSLKSSSRKKKSLKSPLERLGAIMKTWITQETTAYIQSSFAGSTCEGSMSFRDPRIQQGYASLCQRLDSQQKDFEDLINDADEGADPSSRSQKSIPDYSALKKESEELQLRVTEFLTGRKPEAPQKTEESEENDPVYIPSIDAFDQKHIRIKIVLDRLDKFLPDHLAPLHLSVQDVSSLVRELVYTFKFDKDNIVFKPSEWILVAVFVLKMLGKKKKSIAVAFTGESAVRHFTILFNGIGATMADFDAVTEDILFS
ncbi:hypothetical protein BsWGS_20164 [Bradybaena similaris]